MKNSLIKLCRQKYISNQRLYKYNRKKITANYYKEFTLLEGFNDFSYELGSVLDSYLSQPEKPCLQFALLRIHEKSIKIFREAVILMENGSASGAMARWRTLFEISIVAQILNKYPELADKYVQYSKVDDYKYARKLLEYKKRLNLINYNLDAYPDIENEYKKVCKKYGWNGKINYEWARNDYIKNPNLFELAKEVEQEHLYAYVDESNLYNHPSSRYLINDRGRKPPNIKDKNNYLFSPFEMELPMQLILISLQKINLSTIICYSELELTNNEQLIFYLKQNEEFVNIFLELINKRINQKK